MTPKLRALLTQAANRDPFALRFSVIVLLRSRRDAFPSEAEIEEYFTPVQRRLLRRQKREIDAAIARQAQPHISRKEGA